MFLKFGKKQNQQLQLFVQSQVVRQGQGYNGIAGSSYLSGTDPNTGLYTGFGVPVTTPLVAGAYPNSIVPLFPRPKRSRTGRAGRGCHL